MYGRAMYGGTEEVVAVVGRGPLGGAKLDNTAIITTTDHAHNYTTHYSIRLLLLAIGISVPARIERQLPGQTRARVPTTPDTMSYHVT